MVLRNTKDKGLKRTDKSKGAREARLLSKLQKESLKGNGDSLEAPKKEPGMRRTSPIIGSLCHTMYADT